MALPQASLLAGVADGDHGQVLVEHQIALDGWTARVDFYLPTLGVVVEMDGMCKYEGGTGMVNLVAEKRREDQIRARGYGVARIEWADLFRPERVHAKIRAAALTARVHGSGRSA